MEFFLALIWTIFTQCLLSQNYHGVVKRTYELIKKSLEATSDEWWSEIKVFDDFGCYFSDERDTETGDLSRNYHGVVKRTSELIKKWLEASSDEW